MTERTVSTPNVDFTVIDHGEGPLVLALHGFPDGPKGWMAQLPALVGAGYRVVTPYMRGYRPTSAPRDGRYDAMALAEDVGALIEALGADDAIVMGHDWGAVAAYFGALLAPQRVRRLVTMAVPYGPRFFAALRDDYAQQRRSWYMFFFQQAIADRALAHDDFAMIDGLVRDWSPDWTPPPAWLAHVKDIFRRPGTVESALAYYRQTMGPAFGDPAQLDAAIEASGIPLAPPTLYVHGADDGCIGREVAAGMDAYFPAGLRVLEVPGAGHFVHHERAEVVNLAILDFLGAG
jgi:pimeloyl-ACP methyl ester carboxylesterase